MKSRHACAWPRLTWPLKAARETCQEVTWGHRPELRGAPSKRTCPAALHRPAKIRYEQPDETRPGCAERARCHVSPAWVVFRSAQLPAPIPLAVPVKGTAPVLLRDRPANPRVTLSASFPPQDGAALQPLRREQRLWNRASVQGNFPRASPAWMPAHPI